MDFGQEVAPAGKIFEVEQFVFFEAMHGFHIALESVSRRWNANVLTCTESFAEVPFELATVVGLPDQVTK